jgi:hypothetical protein
MYLPNRENAHVPQAKVVDYLLSRTHPIGRHKGVFFEAFGFATAGWQSLAGALLAHANDYELAAIEDSQFGQRYVIEGIMTMKDGRAVLMRTIWFIDSGEDVPRFVTAYPIEK